MGLIWLLYVAIAEGVSYVPDPSPCLIQVEGYEKGCAPLHVLAIRFLSAAVSWMDQHQGSVIAVTAILIAIFSVALWRSTRGMMRIADQSVHLARANFVATQRPRIIVRFVQGPFRNSENHEYICITVTNIGVTPAIIDAFGGELGRRYQNGEWAPPGIDANPKPIQPITLGSGERHVFTVTSRRPHIGADQLADAWGVHELCALGAIRYRDGNGVNRETGFFRIYNEGSKRFITSTDSEDEYQD